jgi:hypothetical protein
MPELSKTARASMGKQVKEVHVETPEEAIRQLRLNREARLHIGDMSRVDALLKAYDEVKARLMSYEAPTGAARAIADFIDKQMAELPAQEEDPEHMADFERGGES